MEFRARGLQFHLTGLAVLPVGDFVHGEKFYFNFSVYDRKGGTRFIGTFAT